MRSTLLSSIMLMLTTPMDGLSRRSRRPSEASPRKLVSSSRKADKRKSQQSSRPLILINQVSAAQRSLKPPSRNTDTQTSLSSLPRRRKQEKAKAKAKKEERKEERNE